MHAHAELCAWGYWWMLKVLFFAVQFLTLHVLQFLFIEHNALTMSVQFFLMFNLGIALSWEMELLA